MWHDEKEMVPTADSRYKIRLRVVGHVLLDARLKEAGQAALKSLKFSGVGLALPDYKDFPAKMS